MNLYNNEAFVKQIMPPKWRRELWRVNMLRALSKPLVTVYQDILNYTSGVYSRVNLNTQVIVLQKYLNQATGLSDRLLFIIDGVNNGEVKIYLSTSKAGFKNQILGLLNGIAVVGYKYEVILF